MATTSFQLYIDKENAGVPVRHKDGGSRPLGVRGLSMTPNVKTFAGNDSSLTRSGARSALKDVNSITAQPPANKNQKHIGPVSQLFKKPALPDSDINFQKKGDKSQKSKVNVALDSKHRVISKEPLPEKEKMFSCDEYDMLKPKQDPDYNRLASRIWRWKPPCFFGSRQESDSEEDEDIEMPAPPVEKLDSECIDLELIDIDSLDIEDIPIPNIDKDLPIPFLDDSLDIEPNLGTLEIYDSSTPAHLSPCLKK